MDAIETVDLHKYFGPTHALDGLTMTVPTGRIHGFLGPNGAGKSTTLRVLLGLLKADSGRAHVLGADPWIDSVALHSRLAYVPGEVSLWPSLSGGEIIDLLGRLKGGLDVAKRDQLIDRFDLDPTKKARAYSKGNRQKVVLIAALCSPVELLLLDEPTAGLDPLMEVTFRQCLLEEVSGGRTVLLSSHILSEVEALCEEVSIIRKGRIVQTGSLADLRHLTRTSVSAEVLSHPHSLNAISGVSNLQVHGRQIECEVEQEHLTEVLAHLGRLGVASLESRPPTLEELFLRHYAIDEPERPASGQ